ncbi:MAG: dihydrofolate reductase [Proteobacteria bacterium]|nr:dihydrofolate reductase [Pseudomonadota bacterium]
MSFDVVVAVDRAWGIGKDNALPWPRLRGDLAHFKRVTSAASEGRHNAVVMGRRTWDSVGGKPLPNRTNVVISRRPLVVPAGVIAAGSLDDALAAVREVDGEAETTFVVGGAEIYRLAFDHPALRWVYLTRIDGAYACDTVIPDLDARGFVVDATWAGACDAVDNAVHYRIERLTGAPSSSTRRTT